MTSSEIQGHLVVAERGKYPATFVGPIFCRFLPRSAPTNYPWDYVDALLDEQQSQYYSNCCIYFIQVKYAQDLGISSDASSRLVLYLGITTAIGRFVAGFLCSINRLNNWHILQCSTLINGISMILVTLAHNYAPLVAYALVFGFCDGAVITVFNIQALTCVDHTRAASSFGHMLMIASVTSLVGPPISGKTKQKKKKHFCWR